MKIKELNEQLLALYENFSQMKDSNEFYQESLIRDDSVKNRLRQEKSVLAEKVNSLEHALSQSKNNENIISLERQHQKEKLGEEVKKYLKLKKFVMSRMEKQKSIKHKMVAEVSSMLIEIDNNASLSEDEKSPF